MTKVQKEKLVLAIIRSNISSMFIRRDDVSIMPSDIESIRILSKRDKGMHKIHVTFADNDRIACLRECAHRHVHFYHSFVTSFRTHVLAASDENDIVRFSLCRQCLFGNRKQSFADYLKDLCFYAMGAELSPKEAEIQLVLMGKMIC